MPLFICLLTLSIDEAGGENMKDLHKPNMGVYGCHLGYNRENESPIFFETSFFLYLFLFVTMILIANTFFLVLTFKKMREGFKNREKNIQRQGK